MITEVIVVSPNPAKDLVNIDIKIIMVIEVKIFDLTGVLVTKTNQK